MIKLWSIQTILCSLIVFHGCVSQGAVVKSVLGRKVLLIFSGGESFRAGDLVAILFEDGTQKASLLVTNTRRGQALAEIKSGSPEEGDAVRPTGAKGTITPSKSSATTAVAPTSTAASSPSSIVWPRFGAMAIMASYNYQSANVRLTNETTVQTSGTSQGLKFALMGEVRDLFTRARDWRENWIYKFAIGLDRIQVVGTGPNNVCNGSSDCRIDLFGYVPSAQLGYIVAPKLSQLSVHGGLDIFVPFTVQSNLVDGVALHPLSFFNFGAAMQFRAGRHSFIPVSVDFSANVWSFDVIVHRYVFSLGYGW